MARIAGGVPAQFEAGYRSPTVPGQCPAVAPPRPAAGALTPGLPLPAISGGGSSSSTSTAWQTLQAGHRSPGVPCQCSAVAPARQTAGAATPGLPPPAASGGSSSSTSTAWQPLQVGTPVYYLSRSSGAWVPAVILGYNERTTSDADNNSSGLWWSYVLDVQPQAPPSHVVPQRQGSASMPFLRQSASVSNLPAGSPVTTVSEGASTPAPALSAGLHPVPPSSSPSRPAMVSPANGSPLGGVSSICSASPQTSRPHYSPAASTTSPPVTVTTTYAAPPAARLSPTSLQFSAAAPPGPPSMGKPGAATLESARSPPAPCPPQFLNGMQRQSSLASVHAGEFAGASMVQVAVTQAGRTSVAAPAGGPQRQPSQYGFQAASVSAAPGFPISARVAGPPPQARAVPGTPSSPTAPAFLVAPHVAETGNETALQRGCGPELWGITLGQLKDLMTDSRHVDSMTTRDVVERIIKPDTRGTGAGYALLKNLEHPLRATVMVTHAWDAKYSDLVSALAVSGEKGPFWVCATAMYQPEDIPELTLERQMGQEAGGPLTAVLGQVAMLLCVLTATCNVYSRLWCLFEIFTAVQLGVEVRVTSRQSGRYGLGMLDDLLLVLCAEGINSSDSECGCEGDNGCGSIDEAAIRGAIHASPGGHRAVDVVVEEARLAALVQKRDRLVGGGWKDTNIGRQYQEAINNVMARLGKASTHSPTADAAFATPNTKERKLTQVGSPGVPGSTPALASTFGWAGAPPPSASRHGAASPGRYGEACGMGKALLEDQRHPHHQPTPRSHTRQHWSPTVSL